MKREPSTKSALSSMMGVTRRSISSGLYWPSASRLMTMSARSVRAIWKPVRSASPWPRLTTWVTMGKPSRRKVLLRVLADGEARDYLAVSAPRLLHLVEQVEEQGEEQQGRERQEREAAVLQPEQAGKDLAHLRDHRDQGHPEGYEEAEEQAEPAVPATTVPEDAVHREEYGDDYTSEAHVLCRHRLAPATKYMPA